MNTVVIIPARLNSTRLPGKVLLEISGKPMIEHVYRAAQKAPNILEVYIATDSVEVQKVCQRFTSKVIMTREDHPSGTDRLAEAVGEIACDAVVNVQGDEPLIRPELIGQVAQELAGGVPMVSAMHRITGVSELHSPDSVKVVVDRDHRALYFSRAPIPHYRDGIPEDAVFYRHIGIYGFSKEFLLRYAVMEPTPLEQAEKLEQLRVLENGYPIQMIETDYTPVGVDTPEDLARVREMMS